MTTVWTAIQDAKSARNANTSCVPDTPDNSVVLVGIKQWKHLFLVTYEQGTSLASLGQSADSTATTSRILIAVANRL